MTALRTVRRSLCAITVGLLAQACSSDDGDPADVASDVASDAAEDVASDAAPDTAPDVAPDTAPDTAPDADAGDDTASDALVDADDADVVEGRTLDPWPSAPALPACGSATAGPDTIIPGPGAGEAHDAELAAAARQLERQFHVFNTFGVGVNREVAVSLANTDDRALIDTFIRDTDSWDFDDYASMSPGDVLTGYSKVAGAYGGVGAAADAFRYEALRREGADCDELDRARGFIETNLDAMHLATAITGEPGVIARGFARTEQGGGHEPTPLFDGSGDPLPEEKNNGTWRADNSGGLYPDFTWEDSCSRDMLIGWIIGMTATWEVIRDDPAFSDELKDRLVADALAIATSLMTVQDSGYDLEVRDADGRMTYHGILHHESLDRAYFAGAKNGFNAIMGLGIMAGLAFITEDEAVESYVYDELIDTRDYLGMITDHMHGLDLGVGSNFSAYNMASQGAWLAQRYLRDPASRAATAAAYRSAIYDRGGERQPREQKQTFFDFTYAAGFTGESAFTPPSNPLPEEAQTAIANGLETLDEWPEFPYWNFGNDNCDEGEIDSGECVGVDGTEITVLGYIGRKGDLVAEEPLPMRIRPASNYWWRSNPYRVDSGGDGSQLYPGSDFRFVYWMGRAFEVVGADE